MLTWAVSSCPTLVSIPIQLQGAYTTSKPKMQQIIAFCNTNHRLVFFMQKLICARFAVGFENGLPSIYTLKGQPSYSTPPQNQSS